MALLTKPNIQQLWASGGDIVEPTDLKKQQGWTVEVPPHQFENWIQNRQDEYLAHINQRGIPVWDANTEYEAAGLSYVQGSDGKIYKSVAASGPSITTQNPTTDGSDTYWTVAFADFGSTLSEVQADLLYLRQDQNGADIDNAATFRSNIGVTAASESAIGLIEIANTAEAQAFTDDLRALTPKKLADAMKGANMSLSASGYQKFPSGLIIQWGQTSISATSGDGGENTISLPISFPTAALRGIATRVQAGGRASGWFGPYIKSISTTQIIVGVDDTSTSGAQTCVVDWFAIGY